MKAILLSCIILLFSCVSYPKPIRSVELASGAEFALVDSTNFEAFSALQKVTVFWNGHELSFNVQLENTDGAFHLVGLTPVFSRSFLISYSKGILNFVEHPYFKYPVKPENMLADFQMAFAESQHLISDNLHLKTSRTKREFWHGTDLIQTISYTDIDKWKSEIYIINHQSDYRIKITTIQYDSL